LNAVDNPPVYYPPGVQSFAGFWKRFAASLIDVFINLLIGIIVGGTVGFLMGASGYEMEAIEALANVAGYLASWIYFAAFESSEGQATPGKKALGIKVTDLNGKRISFGRASGRFFAKYLSAALLCIGFVMIAFTKRKQGLHDMIAGCLVVNR
jgi:uncharacterized RDD family membrane protein YckC